LPLWVVENRPSPLLWPLAYTTACTTVQAVILPLYVFVFIVILDVITKATSSFVRPNGTT